MLKEIYHSLDTNKKFLIGGSFLGSVREKDIISHDDDCDIGVYVDNENEIQIIEQKIINTLLSKNYKYIKIASFLRFMHIDKKPGVDIFFYILNNNKYVHYSKPAKALWGMSGTIRMNYIILIQVILEMTLIIFLVIPKMFSLDCLVKTGIYLKYFIHINFLMIFLPPPPLNIKIKILLLI